MKNKRSVSLFSALLIVIFHLWVMLTSSSAEVFIKTTAYLGVDIFFFLSAYSLEAREPGPYRQYAANRFIKVYLRYIVFALIAFCISGLSLERLILVVSGIELFTKGGGAFLWFVPAIMLLYLLFPLFRRLDRRNSALTFAAVLVIWAGLALAFTGVSELRTYKAIFIFWNRIPVFLLGYYFSKWKVMKKLCEKWWIQLLSGAALTAVGYWLVYLFAYKSKLQVPFVDMFYVTVIPAALGLILLVSLIPEVKVIKSLGSTTLEMYAIQMVFGYKFANMVLKTSGSKLLTNILSIVFVLAAAWTAHFLLDWIEKRITIFYTIHVKGPKENEEPPQI